MAWGRVGAAVALLSACAVAAAGSSSAVTRAPAATEPLLVLDRFEAAFDQPAHTTRYKALVSSAGNRAVAFTWTMQYAAGRCGNFTVTGASNPQDSGSSQSATVPGVLNTDRYFESSAAYNHEGCTFAQETAQVLTLEIVRADVGSSCRLRYVQTARDGDSPPTPKESPPTTKIGTCTVDVPPPPPAPPPPPKLNAAPPTLTKKEKAQYREYALVASGAGATTAGVGLALIEFPPAAAVCIIVAGVELLLAEYYVLKANDPPDRNYKKLAKVVVPKPRPLRTGNGVTNDLARAANALLLNTAQVVGHDGAFIDSLERAQGAHAAKDAVWDKRQSELAAKLALAEAKLLDARPALAKALRRAAQPVLRTVSSAEAKSAGHALPPALVSLLKSLGLHTSQIAAIRAKVARVPSSALAGPLAPKVAPAAIASAERGGARLLRQIAARLAKRY
ncbi:MAG TPA: hypothetical protein VFR32_06445 [Gaiellaceae bacterium]|nr:hypothetical protein [Gaiellaceae bacterium]